MSKNPFPFIPMRWQRPLKCKKPDKKLVCDTGLLAPTGELFKCYWAGHTDLAEDLGLDDGAYEKYGFVHLDTTSFWRKPDCEPTQRQIDTIFDWCNKREMELPKWLVNYLSKPDEV